jgi:hypothetical protein
MPAAQSLTGNTKNNSNHSRSHNNSNHEKSTTAAVAEEHWTTIPIDDDDDKYCKTAPSSTVSTSSLASLFNMTTLLKHWKGASEFGKAQCQVVIVLLIAYIGNNWKYSYHRNENHNPTMFWVMNIALVVAGLCTLQHEPSRQHRSTGQTIIQLLSRPQTEEWKGWMQWAFIMVSYRLLYIQVINCVSSCILYKGMSNDPRFLLTHCCYSLFLFFSLAH